MEVTCSGCNSRFNIPDDKIPKDQIVKINCPKCKNKITIDPQDTGEASQEDYTETGKFNQKFIEPQKKRPEGQFSNGDQGDDDYALDYYEDVKLALVMADEIIIDKIKPAVEESKFKFITSPTIRESLLKLRFHHFDLIIMADGFDGQEITGGPIMNYLNHLSMSSRRRLFLTLIGDRFKTMDEMMAYALSANMVINTKDLGNFGTLLKRGMMDYQKFYKVFLDILEEEGKM